MMTLLFLTATLVLVVLTLRHKVRRDSIYQDGRRVGSALLGSVPGPPGSEVSFIIVRGQTFGDAPFREDAPFAHHGGFFRIMSVVDRDARSPVLLRLLDVTCRVEGRIRP